ncbi:MAG: type II toxin-antitoxin system VapC family toxin [Thermoguttaceae bacterium]
MSFLLDTNICSAHIRRPAGLAHRFIQHSGRLWVPSIVLAELYAGAYLLDDPRRILTAIDDLRRDVGVLVFDERCAEEFGKLRGVVKRLGASGNPMDLMIASVAIAHDLTMVTHNTADFRYVPGLRLEDWLSA